MKTLRLVSALVLALACAASTQDPVACGDDAATVIQDGTPLMAVGSGTTTSGEWLARRAAEIFRLRIQSRYDPVPEAIDDEYSLVILIDLAPEVLVGAGSPLEIDQEVSIPEGLLERSVADEQMVMVAAGAGHAPAIQRVFVEQYSFGYSTAAAAYHVTGMLSLSTPEEGKMLGSVALDLRGRVPRAFEESTELQIEACFDFNASPPG